MDGRKPCVPDFIERKKKEKKKDVVLCLDI